ncbi:hypothetical protein EVAR_83269_1 [Eumeta japonica]|uniref:Uncharacterized protein n=1 Tax=Eumeta variegata TaxID=151549 RepID=A0A4C1X935_EUMVA|nr:hypothetical protein EVAR_83269_1 [Eumeta japonica]
MFQPCDLAEGCASHRALKRFYEVHQASHAGNPTVYMNIKLKDRIKRANIRKRTKTKDAVKQILTLKGGGRDIFKKQQIVDGRKLLRTGVQYTKSTKNKLILNDNFKSTCAATLQLVQVAEVGSRIKVRPRTRSPPGLAKFQTN